jgi:DNA gyrase subunit A
MTPMDGLSAVERELLLAMRQLGLGSGRPHRKCQRVLGVVLGNAPPSAEALLTAPGWLTNATPHLAAYVALARLSWEFHLRYPLVDAQGNLGSRDGDPPADHCFTECRLSPMGEAVLAGVAPNGLLNGPLPHNVGDLARAVALVAAEPAASLDAVLAVLHGPDFATGAHVDDRESLASIYATGRGVLATRAAVAARPGRLEISALPPGVRPSELCRQLSDSGLVDDVTDASTREGARITAFLSDDPAMVLPRLLASTELRTEREVTAPPLLDALRGLAPRAAELAELARTLGDARRSPAVW